MKLPIKIAAPLAFLTLLTQTGSAQQSPGRSLTPEEQQMNAAIAPLQQRLKPLNDQAKGYYLLKDTVSLKKLEPEMTLLYKKIDSIEADFVQHHPDAEASLDIAVRKGRSMVGLLAEPLFKSLSVRLQQTEKGRQLQTRFDALRKTRAGERAIPFSQPDANGKTISLDQYRGKYVLIDFWASWCQPCRAENPVLLAAFQKYKAKNFDILSVSLDAKLEDWQRAVQQDALPWTQVCDGQGPKTNAAILYGVTSIPRNFLIDPKGIIVATDLRGEALEAELSKLLKN